MPTSLLAANMISDIRLETELKMERAQSRSCHAGCDPQEVDDVMRGSNFLIWQVQGMISTVTLNVLSPDGSPKRMEFKLERT